MASPLMPVSFEDVLAARELLEGVVRPTPLEYSRALSDRVGVEVCLKCENLQRAGSFKIRGAYTRMARLSDEEKAARRGGRQRRQPRPGRRARRPAARHPLDGVHAARRAAAQGRGHPGLRRAASADRAQQSTTCLVAAREFAARDRRGADPPVRPPRHRRRAGHRAAWRSSSSAPTCAPIVVSAGGGGLLAGIATAVKAQAARRAGGRRPGRGRRRPTRPRWPPGEPVPLALDGARWPTASRSACPGEVALRDRARAGRRRRDGQRGGLSRALLFLLERAKLVVEPAGAAAVAALLRLRQRRLRGPGGRGALRRQHRPAAAAADASGTAWPRPGATSRSGCACPTGRGRWPGCWPSWPTAGRQRARGRARADRRRAAASTRWRSRVQLETRGAAALRRACWRRCAGKGYDLVFA